MNGKARFPAYLVVVISVAFGAFVLLAGCQKSKPVVGEQPTQTTQDAAPVAPQQGTQMAEQTTCPVMGGAIDKKIFIEYKGKKVYFCCAACVDTFKANPEKYISKLPQFAK